MPISDFLLWSAYIGGFVAVIIALQIWSGFPPFYRKVDAATRDAEFRTIQKQLFWLFPALILPVLTSDVAPQLVVVSVLFSLGIHCRVVWRIRNLVAARQPTSTNYFVITLEHRWPLAMFDLWTLGLTTVFLLLTAGRALI